MIALFNYVVQITLNYAGYNDETQPFMEGGGLRSRYYFHQMHFHWGSDDTHGSEHTVGSKPLYNKFFFFCFSLSGLKDIFFILADAQQKCTWYTIITL